MTMPERRRLASARRDCLLFGAQPGLVQRLVDREEIAELEELARRLLRRSMSLAPSPR